MKAFLIIAGLYILICLGILGFMLWLPFWFLAPATFWQTIACLTIDAIVLFFCGGAFVQVCFWLFIFVTGSIAITQEEEKSDDRLDQT